MFDVKCYYANVNESHICEGSILYSINGSPCKCDYRANLINGRIDLIGEIQSFSTPEWKDAYAQLEKYIQDTVKEYLRRKKPDAICQDSIDKN